MKRYRECNIMRTKKPACRICYYRHTGQCDIPKPSKVCFRYQYRYVYDTSNCAIQLDEISDSIFHGRCHEKE